MTSSKDLPPRTNAAAMFIENQFLTKLPKIPKEINFRGQVAIVTGASSGLGLESSRQLLKLGLSHLIIAVRSVDRGKKAASELQSTNPDAKIDVWPLEMESYESVQAFARRCDTELSHLDAVILNAGLAAADFAIVKSTSHEKIMQVNYLSTVLLTILLLPILKAKSRPGVPGRLTVVNSAMSYIAEVPNRNKRPLLSSFDDTKITPWDPTERYNSSKLLGQLFLSRLAELVPPQDVILNMVEPGLVKGTGLFKEARGMERLVLNFISMAARTTEQGASTFIDAVAVQGESSHGSFIVNCKVWPLGKRAYGPEGKILADQVWEETLDEFRFADARGILEALRH